MSSWETTGKSDEWYTPKYIFDAMCETGTKIFDLDVASPSGVITHVPCLSLITEDSLQKDWNGYVWMNPPFGGRNSLVPWLEKFFKHGNGIALTPDRTSAPWYHYCLSTATSMLIIKGKVKFEKPDGTLGKSPSTGTTLWGIGGKANNSLYTSSINNLGKFIKL